MRIVERILHRLWVALCRRFMVCLFCHRHLVDGDDRVTLLLAPGDGPPLAICCRRCSVRRRLGSHG